MKTSVCGYSHTDSPTSCSKSIRWLSPLKRKTMPSWRSPSRSTRSETPESTSMFTVPGSRMPARTVSWISRGLRISTTVDSMSCVASRWESMEPAGPAPMMATWVVMVLRATVFLACRGSLVDVQLVEEREQVVERLEQILVVPDHRRARCDRAKTGEKPIYGHGLCSTTVHSSDPKIEGGELRCPVRLLPEVVVRGVGTSATVPAITAVQSASGGASPPVVAIRWMTVVFPSWPGVVEAADSRTHGMAVGSALTLASAWPTTMLPSLVCHVGPAKCVMMISPRSSKRFARGAARPSPVPLHEQIGRRLRGRSGTPCCRRVP